MRAANKQVTEALIKAGAFDKMGGSRAQMMAGLEKAMQTGSEMQSDAQRGQKNFFGLSGFGAEADFSKDYETLPNVPPWPEMQMLTYEKDVLGFYVTKNPLSQHADTLAAYSTTDTGQLAGINEGAQVVVGGMVTKIRRIVTRTGPNAGSKMAVFTLEDLQGSCEVVMFPRALSEYGHLLAVDKILFVRGKVDCRREVPNIICDELITIDQVFDRLAAKVWIHLDAGDVTAEKVSHIRNICTRHKGKSPIGVGVRTAGGFRVWAIADKKLSVRPDVDFRRKLEAVVGTGNVEFRRR